MTNSEIDHYVDATSKELNGHRVVHRDRRYVMLYGWGFPVEGGKQQPFGRDDVVRDFGSAELPKPNPWRRWRQRYRRRLLQMLITYHQYHLLGTWSEESLRHEAKRYLPWFRERRFRSELAALVREKLVVDVSPFELSGQPPSYEVTSLGVVEAAQLGMCKYPYI